MIEYNQHHNPSQNACPQGLWITPKQVHKGLLLDKNEKVCFTWNAPKRKIAPMHSEILNIIRLLILCALIATAAALGNAEQTETIPTVTPPVPSETQTPKETPAT